MGGKGKRRREKNYREAHGGSSRLPPPPDPSKIDALPSSLRKLISFTSSLSHDSSKESKDAKKQRKVEDGASESKSSLKDKVAFNADADGDLNAAMSQLADNEDGIAKSNTNEAKKKKQKKRKRSQVEDLRFAEAMEKMDYGSKKREKKKK